MNHVMFYKDIINDWVFAFYFDLITKSGNHVCFDLETKFGTLGKYYIGYKNVRPAFVDEWMPLYEELINDYNEDIIVLN